MTRKNLTDVLAPGVVTYLGGASEFLAKEGRLPSYDKNLPIKLWRKVYNPPPTDVTVEETFYIPRRADVAENGVTVHGVVILTSEILPDYLAASENIPPDKGVYQELDPKDAPNALIEIPIVIDTTQYQVYSSPFGAWVDLIGQ
jgi:hypothetical protein